MVSEYFIVKKFCVKKIIYLCTLAVLLFSCQSDLPSPEVFNASDLRWANTRLLQVVMRDNFNPPQASRVYVYPHIAHYAVIAQQEPDSLTDISRHLQDFPELPKLHEHKNAEIHLSALLAFCYTAKKVVFSEHYIGSMIDSLKLRALDGGLSEKTIKASDAFAKAFSQKLSEWIDGDNYIQTRTYDRFTGSVKPWEWRETPPDYTSALEPNWFKLRPLIIPSSDFYKAQRPPEYSSDKNSDFFKMVKEVYDGSQQLDSLRELTAWFWDDNPNVTEHTGHLMTMIHKYAPPGHWLNIVTQIGEKENSSIFKQTKAYTLTAIAMYDGLISCWHEKYSTNLVRPITYIKEYIDPFWNSLIQTPPFPEYTSGHSVVSAAAAEILTNIYGDSYSFTDKTQLLFEMEERSFDSFHEAAWEVSMSRFYGGIHYMQGITEGNKQGRHIGAFISEKLIHDK